MALPQVTATGNVVFEPDFKVTDSGLSRCKLRIACNERKKLDDKWIDGEATFVDVVLWRGLADAAGELNKGQSITVIGKLRVRTYEDKNGNKGTSVEIEAQDIALTLKPARLASEDAPF
jgi:single-strand DNA-binding protein